MPAQTIFAWMEPPAHARWSHPETSHAAARSVRNIRASQRAILALFHKYGSMTLEELACRAKSADLPMSESGVRTRCSELVRLGELRDTGSSKPSRSRRRCIVWGLPG